MSFLCCQWCLNIFSSENGQKSQKKPYRPSGGQDLDEEQLIEHNNNQPQKQKHHLPSEYFTQNQQEPKDLSNQLNVELNLPTSNQPKNRQQDDRRSQSSKGENDHTHDLQDHSEHEHQQEEDEEVTQEKLKPDYSKFSINLDPYDKYYKLLHEKTDNLEKYFALQGKPIDFGQTKSNLKVNKIDTSTFQISLVLPCSYSFYSMLMKDSNPTNKKYLTHFHQHQVLQAFKPNFTKNLTKLKRFNMLEPREFVYLKYSNGSFRQNWEICINDPEDDLLSQQTTEHKRCDVFSVGNFKEINDKLYVRQYVEVDLKSNNMNANIWGKIMHEVKEYYEKLYAHVENYYQKQLL